MEKHSPLTLVHKFFRETYQKIWDKYHRHQRYFLVIPCEITIIKTDISFEARIVNISRTGAFIETKQDIENDINLNINFTYQDEEYTFTARNISHHTVISSDGIGVKFLLDKFFSHQRESIDQFIKVLETQDPPVPTS